MARAAVKSLGAVVDKWTRRASSAGEEFRVGIEQTAKSWAANAKAGASNYAAGVQEAITRGAFAKGIDAAGDAKWKERAAKLGPMRFAQGVQESGPAYSTGVAPVLAAIGAVDLPPRGPVGSPANLTRVGAITNALRMLRTGRRA